ncbi:MAG: MMPL family transporter, partial [Candidatus Eremiobacterota bacterium]
LGLMAYYRVNFNPANFMALPLVLGIGLVFGVHVLQRAQEEKSAAIFGRSTGPAIVLDALTNVAGFGALIFASHQGIKSLGFVMTVGTLTNLITGVLVLPAVLQILKNRGIRI